MTEQVAVYGKKGKTTTVHLLSRLLLHHPEALDFSLMEVERPGMTLDCRVALDLNHGLDPSHLPQGCALHIFNRDDPERDGSAEGHGSPPTLSFGFHPQADLSASSFHYTTTGNKFYLSLQKELVTVSRQVLVPQEWPFFVPLPGPHNLYNTLGALAVALFYDVPPEDLQRRLAMWEGLPRRMERVFGGDFTIVDDMADEPYSLQGVLESIQHLDYHSLYIASTIPRGKGPRTNRESGEVLGTWAQVIDGREILVTTEAMEVNPRFRFADPHEEGEALAFLNGLSVGDVPVKVFHSLEKMIGAAVRRLSPGDLLLLLGQHPMERGASLCRTFLTDSGLWLPAHPSGYIPEGFAEEQ